MLALAISDAASAQETKKKASAESIEEADENAESAPARQQYGPNKASVTIGMNEIFILAGRPEFQKDPGYAAINTLKNGDIVEMTLGQAIKFSTPFNVKFGSLLIKKENVAPDYPGVYSLWLKKTEKGWNLVFNEKPDIWGTMHKSQYDVGETALQYSAAGEPTKSLKLDMTAGNGKGELSIAWGKHKWYAPFTIEP
jgi:hypothetical protein